MAWQLKGKVAGCEHREYGFANIHVEKIGNGADALFEGLGDELEVRGDDCNTTPSYKLTCENFAGLDVPRRSTLRNSSRLSHYWPYFQCPLRSDRPQRQTMVWYSVPSRSHPLPTRTGSHRKVRSWYLFLFDTLDDGQLQRILSGRGVTNCFWRRRIRRNSSKRRSLESGKSVDRRGK